MTHDPTAPFRLRTAPAVDVDLANPEALSSFLAFVNAWSRLGETIATQVELVLVADDDPDELAEVDVNPHAIKLALDRLPNTFPSITKRLRDYLELAF